MGPERILVRDDQRYIAHPHLARLAGGSWLLVATSGPRRPVTLHPPLDPDFITIGLWSDNEGETWSNPAPLPVPGLAGTECGGLTALLDGGVLLNQWRFRWYADPAEAIEEPWLTSAADLRRERDASRELDGPVGDGTITWARGGGAMTLWWGDPGDRCWTWLAEPDLDPYSGGYGLRGGIVAASGDMLVPLTDPPHYRSVFLIRSCDGGTSWRPPEPVASAPHAAFEEPSTSLLGDGTLLMLLRENVGRQLRVVRSHDHGVTWTEPRPAGLPGFPAHLVALNDGRLAALPAVRDAPGSILLSLSADDGDTWGDPPIVVAGDLASHDIGYPTAALARDGTLLAAYYRRDATGVTGLYARRVEVPHHA